MRSILLTFFIAITSICFSQTTNDDWIYITASWDNVNTYYVRKTYVSKKVGIIKIWIKTNSQKYKFGKKTYKYALIKNLYLIDCSNQRTKTISSILYDSEGNVIDSTDIDESLVEWKNAAPETIVNKVCSLFN